MNLGYRQVAEKAPCLIVYGLIVVKKSRGCTV